MNKVSVLFLLLLFLVVTSGVFFNTDAVGGVGVIETMVEPGAPDDPAIGDEAIEKAMAAMKSAGRSIRRSLRKNDVATALQVVNRMQISVIEAKKLVPVAAKKLKGEARTAIERDFRQRLITVLERWIQIEKALLQGDTEQASELMKGISELKKSAHKEFEVDD